MTGFAGERRTSMNSFRAIKAVYSYLLPEVRVVIDEITRDYPHDVFLRSVPPPGLDDFHVPIIDRLVDYYKESVPALGGFQSKYPTAGSEEGIKEFMTRLRTDGENHICVIKGDYEGFSEVAKTRGLDVWVVNPYVNPKYISPSVWFISNPSARNGRHLPDGLIYDICEAGHKVFYDMSYLGTTTPMVYDLSHPNIVAAAISFSKPYGLFYYRIGFTFSREPIPALYGNKWFKNVFSLLVADRVMQMLDIWKLSEKYRTVRARILEKIRTETGLPLHPSEVFLLAYLEEKDVPWGCLTVEQMEMIKPFDREGTYRFCLTPYFMEEEGIL